jgi:hypothetical protein
VRLRWSSAQTQQLHVGHSCCVQSDSGEGYQMLSMPIASTLHSAMGSSTAASSRGTVTYSIRASASYCLCQASHWRPRPYPSSRSVQYTSMLNVLVAVAVGIDNSCMQIPPAGETTAAPHASAYLWSHWPALLGLRRGAGRRSTHAVCQQIEQRSELLSLA